MGPGSDLPGGDGQASGGETEEGPARETGIVVRPADQSDVEALIGLQEELISLHRQLRPIYYRPISGFPEQSRSYFLDLLGSPEWAVYVAEELGSRVRGYATAILHHRPALFGGGVEAHLDDLYVAPTHRHFGVGAALLETVCTWARARQAERLTLWVDASNESAQAFYAQSGFREYEKFLALELEKP